MKLQEIDKALYRKHLNIVIIGFIGTFALLSLAFGAIMIAMLAEPAVAEEQVSNFRYNLLGVILALLLCGAVLHQLRHSEFFKEIYYVWKIKQIQNLIYRKVKRIKNSAEENNADALLTLWFYYTSLIQVYRLDDNTITLSKVEAEKLAIEGKIQSANLQLSLDDFDKSLIATL